MSDESPENSPDLQRDLLILRAAVPAALFAGQEIMKIYSSDFTITQKEDRSPLTEADRQAHRVIHEALTRTGIPVLSEEGRGIPYEERSGWPELFIVDPLDGTKEFIKRNGEFTVNIALVREGEPVIGVIYVPAQDVLYYGVKGFCAVRVKDALQEGGTSEELPLQPLPEIFTVVSSRSHASPETNAYVEELEKKHGRINFAASGSSLKFCLLAEGKAQCYPRFAPTMEWDTAAGQAILEAAGGKVLVHPSGEPLRYNREELRNPWFLALAK